ncbi:MAG TPA: beta-phosphoglucomutase family hydrolase [Bryobacteraceae bacterium]|nr:beta-phosphoglucomutase family hydrolase [Bryobacteraceae bacterium]
MARDLALILDMDGVILHSNPLHREAWEAYSRRFGIEVDEAMHQRMYGRRNDDIVRDFFGPQLTPDQVREHGAAKERLYREMMGPVINQSLVPGVREFLERHRDLPLAMATSAEPENVEFLLDSARLRPYFRAVVDGHQVHYPKPDPEIYLKAAELLGVPPRDCVAFEDSFAGVQSARAAGMTVVGLTTTHDELPGVDLEIPDFNSPELEPWLASR